MYFLLSFKQLTGTECGARWYVTKYEEFECPGAALHRAGFLINTGVAVHIEPMRRQ